VEEKQAEDISRPSRDFSNLFIPPSLTVDDDEQGIIPRVVYSLFEVTPSPHH
jgi:hypothetical protein